MYRSYTLGLDDHDINRILNSRRYVVQKVEHYISDSGVAGTILHYDRAFNAYTRRERLYERTVQKFYLDSAGANPYLDDILEDRANRVITMLSKFTEQGPIVVIDYERKQKKGRG